jgi:hypothetical protein
MIFLSQDTTCPFASNDIYQGHHESSPSFIGEPAAKIGQKPFGIRSGMRRPDFQEISKHIDLGF